MSKVAQNIDSIPRLVSNREESINCFIDKNQPDIINIKNEFNYRSNDVEKLEMLSNTLLKIPSELVKIEIAKLEETIKKCTGYTKIILEHTIRLHQELMDDLIKIIDNKKISKEGYSKFLMQGWYHTSFTSRFETMFTDKLDADSTDNLNTNENKFAKLNEEGIDEEEGHELWALQDILDQKCFDNIHILNDIYPETKLIVSSQHDRLTRLDWKGFLGYSFYLEFLIASKSYHICQLISENLDIPVEKNRFMYFHYLVDQGHAKDNLDFFDEIIQNEKECNEVIDNMNIIHFLYKNILIKSFSL